MSSSSTRTAAVAAADASTEPGISPTVTHYQQLATEFCKQLDAIAAIIPNLELTHASTAKLVRSRLNVPMEFIATAVAVVDQVPELQSTNRLDVVAARDALQFIEAFRPVADKVVAFSKSLTDTIDKSQAGLAANSLQAYAIAKALARDVNSASVAAHVANMKRDLGRRGRPKGSTTKAVKLPPPFLPLPNAIKEGGMTT
ncbi:MAG TPA: hypothetical protein VJZ76_20150 [Thermoanaerobaculia bacterium]|nr:hypothetical protein [Thermoanaerobaculia bacterium]